MNSYVSLKIIVANQFASKFVPFFKMKNRPLLFWILLTIGISFSGGYILHNGTRGSSGNRKYASSSFDAKASKSLRARKGEEERLRSQQTRINLEESDGCERWLHWISAIENASLHEFPQLARVAHGNESFLQLLAQRWFDRDPWHFFHSLEKESKLISDASGDSFPQEQLSKFLFETWIRKDPDSVIEALSSSTKLRLLGLSGYRRTVFFDIMESDPRRGLTLMNRWDIRRHGPGTKGVEKWAKENPREVAAAILENAAGYGTEHCMEAVAKVWAKSNPEGALAFAMDAKGKEGEVLRETVFREWLAKDMAAASDWLMARNDPELDDSYRPMVIEAWAKEDPHEALAWCEEHLTGADLSESITKLVQGAAAVDIESAADLVAKLEPGKLQREATVELAKEWFPTSWGDAKITQQAVEWVRSLEDNELKEAVVREVGQSWTAHDMEGFKDFLTEEENLSLPISAGLVRTALRSDPEGTMEWVSGLEEKRSLSATRTAFVDWLRIQPAQATTWLADLPSDDTRRPTMLKSLVWDVAFSEREAVAAEKLRGLSASDRAQARTMVETSRISEERKERMRKILGQ